MSQKIKQAVPEIHEEGDKSRFNLNSSIKIGEKVFCSQMQTKLLSLKVLRYFI